jgi:hypothetical protein
MIRDLYASLTPREQRGIRWCGVATAAVLWFSTAWADPWVLLTVPMIAGGYFAWHVRERRRRLEHPTEDADWDF